MTRSGPTHAAQAPAKMASPAAADLIGMFVQRNPTSSRGELTEVG